MTYAIDSRPKTDNPLINSVRGWFRSGCGCPMSADVSDWGIPGCHRQVVNVKYAGHGEDVLFYGEYDTNKEAQRVANSVNAAISREWNALKAGGGAC